MESLQSKLYSKAYDIKSMLAYENTAVVNQI